MVRVPSRLLRSGIPAWSKRSILSLARLPSSVIAIALAAGTTLAVEVAPVTAPRSAWAQQAQRFSLIVAPMTHAAPSSKTQLAIQVGPLNVIPKDSYILVRGLPPYAALSEGHAITPGTWSVPLIAARNLSITLPPAQQGKSDIVIGLVTTDGVVLAEAKTVLMIVPAAPPALRAPDLRSIATTSANPDPSPLAVIQKGFDQFFARRTAGARRAPTGEEKAEMFRQFLTWPQNPLEVEVTVRLTSSDGAGKVIGTLAVRNSEILVAGRKDAALFLRPNLRGLRPGLYAFHVHEYPNCGPALKDGELVPGLGAGTHLWLSGIGEMSGTTFTSHLGDLPKLVVENDGTSSKTVVAARLTLADVANRSFVIHASSDDNSPRLACAPFH